MRNLSGLLVFIIFLVIGAPLASAQCVGGVNGTPQQGSYLLQNEFQDGRPAGSITPACMRDLIATTTVGDRVTAVGAVASSDAPSCTAVGSNASMTCTGALSSFAAGQHVTVQVNTTTGPGPASSLTQPTITVAPTTLDASLFTPTGGCHVTASVGSITTGTNILNVNNTRLYQPGDSIVIAGAGVSAAALTTTISSVQFANWTYTLAANASTTVNLAAVTGFNCTTTWRYQVAAVDALGGKSQASAIVQTTVGASELTPSNYNTITLNTVTGATAYLLYSCRGTSCTPSLSGIEMPNKTYNVGADPLLQTFNSRGTPTTITFHDWNMPYARDDYAGLVPPAAATKQQLDTTISSISGGTVVLANAPTNSGTFIMRHDNGPAFAAAIAAACAGNGVAVAISPGYYDVGSTFSSGGANCFSVTFEGPASGFTNSGSFKATTVFNWVGPIGGTVFDASGQSGGVIGGMTVSAGENSLGGATPGIGVDYDQIGAPSATKMWLSGINVTNAGIGLRLCNSGGNCDSMTIDQFEVGGLVGLGAGYGIYDNAPASLSVDIRDFDINANIGVFAALTGGNMNFSHGLLGDGQVNEVSLNYYGGIGFWNLNYTLAAIRFQDVHSEYLTKFFYAPGDNNQQGMECDDCRIAGQQDWDGYQIRIGQGQVVLSSTTLYTPGVQVGSLPPAIFAETGSTVTDLGGGRYGSYPNLVGGGGTWIGLGSEFESQVGASSNGNLGLMNVQLGFPYAVTGTPVTAALGGGSLAAGACTSGTVTVTGATTAMTVSVSPVATPLVDASHGVSVFGFVSSANTVTVEVCAIVATTPTARVYNVRVLQ